MTGILLGIIAALFSTSKDLVSKSLASTVDGATSAFASFFFALPIYAVALLVLWLMGIEHFHTEHVFWMYVVSRSLSDSIAETSKMYALSNGELSVVSSIIALHPIFMLVTSPLITRDPLTPLIVIGLLCSVSGTFLITFKSTQEGTSKKGIIFALICSLFFSINSSLDRVTVQAASPAFSGFIMTLFACFLLLPPLLRTRRYPVLAANIKPFLLRGFFETTFMIVKLSALLFLTAPELSAITRLSVMFSVIGGNVMFKEIHLVRKLLGALLTITGIVIILLGHPL